MTSCLVLIYRKSIERKYLPTYYFTRKLKYVGIPTYLASVLLAHERDNVMSSRPSAAARRAIYVPMCVHVCVGATRVRECEFGFKPNKMF